MLTSIAVTWVLFLLQLQSKILQMQVNNYLLTKISVAIVVVGVNTIFKKYF